MLEIDDAGKIAASGTPPSFAEFNRDFLKTAEGFSMLVLEGGEGQGAEFAKIGLSARPPFYFERDARGPDGTLRRVAFTLCFVDHPDAPMAGFFTCQHHSPENFWWPEYQAHPNGAASIAQIDISTDTLKQTVAFAEKFVGRAAKRTAGEFAIDSGRGVIRVHERQPSPGRGPRLAGFTLNGVDLANVGARARSLGLDFEQTASGLVFAADVMYGVGVTLQA